MMNSYRFYLALETRGRSDLAAANAAVAGRFRLAVWLGRREGLSSREAWRVAWHSWRKDGGRT